MQHVINAEEEMYGYSNEIACFIYDETNTRKISCYYTKFSKRSLLARMTTYSYFLIAKHGIGPRLSGDPLYLLCGYIAKQTKYELKDLIKADDKVFDRILRLARKLSHKRSWKRIKKAVHSYNLTINLFKH